MEEIHVAAREQGGQTVIESYDAQQLFEAGTSALRERSCPQALAMYGRLLREFSASRFAAPARYNAALCYEEQRDWPQAIRLYREMIEQFPDSPDVLDALFRLGGAQEQAHEWEAAAATFATVLGRPSLGAEERIEAMARRGSALCEMGRLDPAEALLRETVAYYRTAGAEQVESDFFVAQAQYYVGEVVRARARAIGFTLEPDQMRRALEERAHLLLLAQAEYILTIRVTNPHWAAAAGFRIGSLYSELYDALLAAPVPPELSAPEREVYFEELRRQIRPLVEKAIRVWERTILMAERTGIRNEWVARTGQELERVRRMAAGLPAPAPPPPSAPAPRPPPPPAQPAAGPFG